MPTFSVTVESDNKKYELTEYLKDIQKEYHHSKLEYSLDHVFEIYFKKIEELRISQEPPSIRETIEKIGCSFLEYEDFNFKCFELMNKKKKPDNLGDDPTKLLVRCQSCKDGKAQAILEQYQKKLRGQNIRGIVQMIKLFESFAEKGVPSTIHFCNRIKGRQVMTGTNMIICSKHDSKVQISPTCTDPKCPHYESYSIYVTQEFPEEALHLIEGIAEDYKRIEDLTSRQPKEVDSKVIEK